MPTANAGANFWPALNPGRMTLRMRVLRSAVTSGASGAAVQPETVVDAYAEVLDGQRGNEAPAQGQVISQHFLTLRTWFDARIKSHMQLETEHGLYDIQQAINEREMGVSMRLVCLAIGADE